MQFIIASHGKMATGIKNTVELLIGDRRKILAIEAYVDEESPIRLQLDEMTDAANETTIIFTDIAGGSVNREIMMAMRNRNTFIVTDFNLSLLLELATKEDSEINEQTINESIELCQKQMRCFNMQKETDND